MCIRVDNAGNAMRLRVIYVHIDSAVVAKSSIVHN